jgi:hypothetical protein
MSVVSVICLFNNVIIKSIFFTILSSKLQEIVFIKVEGQQLLKHSLISTKTVLNLVENSTEPGQVIIIMVSLA